MTVGSCGWRSGWLARCIGVLFSPTCLAIAGQGFASGTNFLTGFIVGRACSKEEYGLYFLGFTVWVFVMELQNSLISTPYMVFGPRLEGRAHARYTGSTLYHQLVLSVLVIAVLIAGARMTSLGAGPGGLAPVLWTLVAVMAFIMLRDYVRRLCFANFRMMSALLLDACVAVCQIGGLYLLARHGLLNASRAYWTVGTVCAVVAVGWLALNRRMFDVDARRAIVDFRRNWSFGKWVCASAVLWAASMNVYPWLLAHYEGTAAAGVFGACILIVNLGNVLLMGAQNFLGPRIAAVYAEGGAAPLRRFVFKATAAFCTGMVAFCAAMWAAGDWLLMIFGKEKYVGNGLVVFVLAVNLLALAMAFPFSRGLFAVERADVDFAVNFVALLVLVTLGIWLTRAYGPLGAACGLMTANVAAMATRGAAFAVLVHPPDATRQSQ